MKFNSIAALALAASAIGAVSAAKAEPFSGPYIGAQTGWEDTRGGIGSGLTFGLLAGWNFKASDNLVLGLEGSIDESLAKGGIPSITGDAQAKAGRSLGLGARAGFLATPETLIYAKAGYANVRTSISGGGIPVSIDRKFNTDALTVGGGVEYAFTERATFRAGYDYANGENGYQRHQVRAGLAFHF